LEVHVLLAFCVIMSAYWLSMSGRKAKSDNWIFQYVNTYSKSYESEHKIATIWRVLSIQVLEAWLALVCPSLVSEHSRNYGQIQILNVFFSEWILTLSRRLTNRDDLRWK
jgi:hypothetical protein